MSTASSATAACESAPKLRVGICQIKVGESKENNIARAEAAIAEAKSKGAQLVVLPEIWNGPYSTTAFPKYAEPLPSIGQKPDAKTSPSAAMLCKAAKQHGVWLVGGSVSEREEGAGKEDKLYNCSLIINPSGAIVGKHRKAHLFDIDIPGRVTFRESDSLTAGGGATVVDTGSTFAGMIGVGICYDMRFPELATVMRQRGCRLLVYPGAFNMTTGPLHWELLQRARAVDNAAFVVTCSPARAKGAGYVAYGHSSVISPMGEVLCDAGVDDNVSVVEVDMGAVDSMRASIPCWTQKRHDIYETVDKQGGGKM